MHLSWRRTPATTNDPTPDWHICAWQTEEMEYSASPQRLFVEALDTALRPPQQPKHVNDTVGWGFPCPQQFIQSMFH